MGLWRLAVTEQLSLLQEQQHLHLSGAGTKVADSDPRFKMEETLFFSPLITEAFMINVKKCLKQSK